MAEYAKSRMRQNIADLDSKLKIGGEYYIERKDRVNKRPFTGKLVEKQWKGQFFTPISIAELMAEISTNQVKRIIEEEGYITVNEPAVGAGAMIIGLAKVLERHGYNYQKQMVVIAQDIDIKSVYMTYIQLSLLGIAAKIMHANTITLEVFEEWDTPFYTLNMWDYRLKKDRVKPKEEVAAKFNMEEGGQLTIF